MARPKAVLLPCGLHFGPADQPCQMCAEAERIRAQEIAAAQIPVSRPDPTRGADAGAPRPAVTAALGTGEPVAGVYDLPDSIYHRDPLRAYGTESLSGSTARYLLPPSTPAHYRWRMDHPTKPSAEMILGSAVHALVLETADLVIFEGASWNSKAGRDFLAEYNPDGDEAPILEGDVLTAKAMAHALRSHPIATKALRNGQAEQALFAQDPETGVWLRGKLDYLQPSAGDHLIVTDVKTCRDASAYEFARAAAKLHYHVSDAHYSHLIKTLGIAKSATLIYTAVESHPPYLVSVHQISDDDMRRGEELDQLAIRTFARCLEAGQWPGYSERITKLTFPAYATKSEEETLFDAATEGETL